MPLSAILLYCSLLIFPSAASKGVHASLELCINVLIPSIYPFTVCTNMLLACNLGQSIANIFKKPFTALFHISPELIFPCILGIFAGYPQGTLGILSVYERGGCTKQEAEHALCFCNNTGIAFILGALAAMLGDVKFALKLFAVQLICAFGYALLFRPARMPINRKPPKTDYKSDPTLFFSSAARSIYPMAVVCSNVMIFGVISELLKNLSLPNTAAAIVLSVTELSNAASFICKLHYRLYKPILAFAVVFSGICVHLQIFCCVKGRLSMKKFFFSKLFQGIFAFLIILFCESY